MGNQVLVQNELLFDYQKLTSSYSSLDWDRLTESWTLIMYTVDPVTQEPVDEPSESYSYETREPKMSWDEVMEEVLTDRAEAWDQLADL